MEFKNEKSLFCKYFLISLYTFNFPLSKEMALNISYNVGLQFCLSENLHFERYSCWVWSSTCTFYPSVL